MEQRENCTRMPRPGTRGPEAGSHTVTALEQVHKLHQECGPGTQHTCLSPDGLCSRPTEDPPRECTSRILFQKMPTWPTHEPRDFKFFPGKNVGCCMSALSNHGDGPMAMVNLL